MMVSVSGCPFPKKRIIAYARVSMRMTKDINLCSIVFCSKKKWQRSVNVNPIDNIYIQIFCNTKVHKECHMQTDETMPILYFFFLGKKVQKFDKIIKL